MQRLEEECLNGKGLGFNGKQCIHPLQVDVVQRIFAPQSEELDWAVRVVVADAKAVERGRGAWSLDGVMIDAPVVGKARALLARADACGIGIERRVKWSL